MERSHFSTAEVPQRPQPGERDEPITLGVFLRNTRLARNITLDAVEARTKIRRELLDDIERNNLGLYPSERFYEECSLRAYASAVGLDPREVVGRFRREFPDADAQTAAVQVQRTRRPVWLVPTIAAAALAVVYAVGQSRQPAPYAHPVETPGVEFPVAVPASVRPDSAQPAGLQPAAAQTVSPYRAAENVSQPETSRLELAAATAPEGDTSLLAPADYVEGELAITSDPLGAHVTVNGIGRGATPVVVRFLPPGSYTVRIIGSGYPIQEQRVTITSERPRARVSVTLQAPPAVETSP